MWQKQWIVLAAVLAVAVGGCGGSDEPGVNAAADGPIAESDPNAKVALEPPAAALDELLDAWRGGDHKKTKLMLTTVARETVDALQIPFEPPASDTAEFEIGEVRYTDPDTVHVACTLSELGEDEKRLSDEVVWKLRRDPSGWRIASLSAEEYKGGPIITVDFENRQEMAVAKAAMEQADLPESENSEAQQSQLPKEPIRR